MEIFLFIFAILFIVEIWAFIAIELTYRQRIRLIDRRPKGNLYWKYSEEFNKVKYKTHFWHVFFFLDPKKLYGPLNQDLF